MNPAHRSASTSLEESLSALAATIRDAGESLLDLQDALHKLRLVSEPGLARSVQLEVSDAIRNAMR